MPETTCAGPFSYNHRKTSGKFSKLTTDCLFAETVKTGKVYNYMMPTSPNKHQNHIYHNPWGGTMVYAVTDNVRTGNVILLTCPNIYKKGKAQIVFKVDLSSRHTVYAALHAVQRTNIRYYKKKCDKETKEK